MHTPAHPASTLSLEKHPWGVIAGIQLDDDEAMPAPLPREARLLVNHLMSGLRDRDAAPLAASWGEAAHLVADFASRTVMLDPRAQRLLGEHHGLPLSRHGLTPGPQAIVRSLDDVAWDIGQICGRWQLIGNCCDAWQQPLVAGDRLELRRLLSLPLPMPLLRLMLDHGTEAFSPAEAESACGLSRRVMRGTLQACLLLGLLRWHQPPAGERCGCDEAPAEDATA